MRAAEIVEFVRKIVNECDGVPCPYHICEKKGIPIRKIKLNPVVYKAYTNNITGYPIISINERYTRKSQVVLLAHELGHALLHSNCCFNEFGDTRNDILEYEANLFAVALLFDENEFNVKFHKLDNYVLKSVLDCNIKLESDA